MYIWMRIRIKQTILKKLLTLTHNNYWNATITNSNFGNNSMSVKQSHNKISYVIQRMTDGHTL